MGKTANCIKMLQYLNTGKLYKISELAELLGTKPRNIIEYKEELNSIFDSVDSPTDFLIETVPGRYGGYRINGNAVLPMMKLTDLEKQSFIDAYLYISERQDFPNIKTYSNAFNKILNRIEYDDKPNESVLVIDRYPLAMPPDEINKRYKLFEEAIRTHHVVNIDHLSNDNVVRNRNVQPYKLYMYNNAWFLLCYCELAKDYRYFKLNRISKYEMLDRKFSKDYFYKEQDFFDNFGMTANTEDFHIKVHLFNEAAMYVKDYIYGKNQVITECKDGTTILECDLRYRNNCISFVLEFRGNCEVIEPKWLKEEVVSKAQTIIERNKKA